MLAMFHQIPDYPGLPGLTGREMRDRFVDHLQDQGLDWRTGCRVESIDPLTAGLGFAVKPQVKDFIGKAALLSKPHPPAQQRVGLMLAGRRIAREGTQVLAGQVDIGEVTSGTFSPTLEKSIAMAYIARDAAIVGANVAVDVRGQCETATIVALPFYRRPRA